MDASGWLLNGGGHEFRGECGESLNIAINGVADVLHTLCTEAHQEQRGDLNGDGQITVVDAVIALQIVVSGEYDGDAADMDGDGRVTSVDVLTILWTAVAVYTNLMVVWHSAGRHPFFTISTDSGFEYPKNIIFIL